MKLTLLLIAALTAAPTLPPLPVAPLPPKRVRPLRSPKDAANQPTRIKSLTVATNVNPLRMPAFIYPKGFNPSNHIGWLEYKVNLSDTNWQKTTLLPMDGALAPVTDFPIKPDGGRRFFRMHWVSK